MSLEHIKGDVSAPYIPGMERKASLQASRIVFEMCSTAIQEERGRGIFPSAALIPGQGLLNPIFKGHHLSILHQLPSHKVDFVLFIRESG